MAAKEEDKQQQPFQPFEPIQSGNESIALVNEWDDHKYTYHEINNLIDQLAHGLLLSSSSDIITTDLNEERIGLFFPACVEYVTILHAIWRAGGIAVPLNVASAIPELHHCLLCASVTRLILPSNSSEEENGIVALQELCASLNIQVVTVPALQSSTCATKSPLPKQMSVISSRRRALIVFTSGTTSKPKGVVTTHGNISSQIQCLIKAWKWSSSDVIPLFLPLHHVHGIINVLCSALWIGATVYLYRKFHAPSLCTRIQNRTFTIFMAVPTIYVKLIQYLNSLSHQQQQQQQQQRQTICDGFRSMRLNVSGSAACPITLFHQWQDLTGQILLERYGMTEIGMALSNPYDNNLIPQGRRAGSVGIPLPGVQIQLYDNDHHCVITSENIPGEIRVRGNNVFLEYWNNPQATQKAFSKNDDDDNHDHDDDNHDRGWFHTGDVAVLENGYYRIMGRSSMDIIKSGGYKLSALEIENVILTRSDVAEVAVIGIPDEVWGEAVTAFLVLKQQQKKQQQKKKEENDGTTTTTLEYDEFKDWCIGKLSSYKIPKSIILVNSLPRNAMGKVTKSALKEMVK